MRSRAVHWFAIANAAAAFALILIGGLVHGTGSSLACPDWPTCYGSLLPEMKGGVLVEHGHRLAAFTVSVLTLALAVLLSGRGIDRRLRRMGWLAVVLVLVQAGLGGLTVKLRLPTPVSTAHTALSLVFFVTVLWLAVRTRPRTDADDPAPVAAGANRFALLTTVAIYAQMVLGGLVRHSGAALKCVDAFEGRVRAFPLCYGELWPSDQHPTVLIQVMHRMGAVIVTALVFASAVRTWRAAAGRAWLKTMALVAPVLVLAQIALGVASVLTFLDLAAVEAHLGVATALLAVLALTVLLGRPAAVAERDAVRSFATLAADAVRLTKPRITGLVIATFAGGLWLAPGEIPGWRIVMTLCGTALLVGSSNTLNMLLERDVDGLMSRTANRPLPQGRIAPEVALVVGVALAAASLPLLFIAGGSLTGLLAAVAFVSYVGLYTPLKRESAAALFVGAVPGALPPLMGWTTVTGRLDAPGIVLFGILFLWQIPHFLAISIYLEDDYRRAGFRVLSQAQTERATRVTIVAFTAALATVTLLLAPLHVAGTAYVGAALVLGVVFVAWAAAGFRRLGDASRAWARSLFLASIVYLTLLFAALAVGRTVT